MSGLIKCWGCVCVGVCVSALLFHPLAKKKKKKKITDRQTNKQKGFKSSR